MLDLKKIIKTLSELQTEAKNHVTEEGFASLDPDNLIAFTMVIILGTAKRSIRDINENM